MTKPLRIVLGAGLALALVACGSTVQVRGERELGAPTGLGEVPPTGSAGTAENGPTDGFPTSRGEEGDSGSGGSTATGGTTGGDQPSSVDDDHAQAVTSPGGPLLVGVITSGNFGSYASSLGVGVNLGDQRIQAQVMADHLNKHGGIGGRQVKLTFFDYDATSASADGGYRNAQAACSAFTEDNKAFAAVGVAGMPDNYHRCASQRGMVVVGDADLKSEKFFARFPSTYLISDINLTRKYRAVVEALYARQFFPQGAKVGLIYSEDVNDVEAVRDGMLPALARHGIRPTDQVRLSSTDSGAYASQLQASVLKFRADGITHVLFGWAAAWMFQQTAQQQQYFPHYGLDSRQGFSFMQGAVPVEQLRNTVGIGYLPVGDVDAAHDPGPVSSRQTLCKKIYDDAGQGWGTNRSAMGASLALCDQFLFMHDAMAGRTDASPAAFRRGVEQLGSSYASPYTFRTTFGPGRHDGAAAYRNIVFDGQCSCFVYRGALTPFGPQR